MSLRGLRRNSVEIPKQPKNYCGRLLRREERPPCNDMKI